MFHRAASIFVFLLATASTLGQLPIITSIEAFDPVTQGGTRIYINGENFDDPMVALIGGIHVQNLEFISSTCIRGLLPPGAGTRHVVVSNSVGISRQMFTVTYSPPEITQISPSKLPATGGMVTITGKNFFLHPVTTLYVNGQHIQPTSSSHTEIQFIAPPGFAEIVPVQVVVAEHDAHTQISYNEPRIISMTAPSLPTAGGSTVTLHAIDFGPSPIIRVNEMVVPSTVITPNATVQFQLPAGLGMDQKIRIQNVSRSSEPIFFDYDPPVIDSISTNLIPTNGQTMVTLSGSNFGTFSKVFVGGLSAPTTSIADDSITFIPPPIDGLSVSVIVETGDQLSNAKYLSPLPPSITALTPDTLPNVGGPITISGTNFGSNPIVLIRGVRAQVLEVHSDHSQIIAIAPQGCNPDSSVVVVNNHQTSFAARIHYPPCCPGDADGSRSVTFADVAATLANFMQTCENAYWHEDE